MVEQACIVDFDIKYRMGKLNQAADALSHHLKSSVDMSSDKRSEKEYDTLSYEVISYDMT